MKSSKKKNRTILLINPPVTAGNKQKIALPPLGILYLAAVLKDNGYHPEVLDCNVTDYSLKKIANIILRKQPDIVGMSVMTPQIVNALILSKLVKTKNNKIKICIGGPHINSVGAEVFQFSQYPDFLMQGEGEYSFLDLVNNLDGNYKKVKSLIYLKNGKVQINDKREPIRDLDNLPFPDFTMVDLDAYKSPYVEKYPLMPIIASRGCPYRCAFCDAHRTHGRMLRKRSVKNIIDEIEYNVKKFGVGHVSIKDSTFILDKKWVHEFCDELIKRKLNIKWNCNSRVDNLDMDILRKVKKAGCKLLSFGVESGSQTVLNNIHKNITIQQARDAFKLSKKVGLKTYAYFMIGNPGDTVERVKKTIRFAIELDADLAGFHVTNAYPGTEIYEWGLANKALEDPRWYMKRMEYIGLVPLSACLTYEDLSKQQQQDLLKKAFRTFYLRPKFIFRKLAGINNYKQLKDLFNAGFEVIKSI